MTKPAGTSLVTAVANTDLAQGWLQRYQGKRPCYLCVLGYTATALEPQISAAGSSPEARRFTALADAEYIYDGPSKTPTYALPPLQAGVSPALITRAITAGQMLPVYLFNAGLPETPSVPHIDLQSRPARCLSTGAAMAPQQVHQLFQAGLSWGERLGRRFGDSYLILGECVVAGTTTAQAVLTALNFDVSGLMGSSHPSCNHQQKADIVARGLTKWSVKSESNPVWQALAAVGDPMQPFVLGLAMAASRHCGVMLAGGSQMVAVYTLMVLLGERYRWHRQNVAIGTTKWIVNDATSQFLSLIERVPTPPVLVSKFSFESSQHRQLRIFERGYVKEGVGAGGCLIAGNLYQRWQQSGMLHAIEKLIDPG